jgi:hypothetical protein
MVPLLQVGALCGPDAVREFGLLTTPQLHFAVREHRREPYVAATIHAACRGDHMQVRQHNLGLCSLEGTYYDEARPALSRCFAIAPRPPSWPVWSSSVAVTAAADLA